VQDVKPRGHGLFVHIFKNLKIYQTFATNHVQFPIRARNKIMKYRHLAIYSVKIEIYRDFVYASKNLGFRQSSGFYIVTHTSPTVLHFHLLFVNQPIIFHKTAANIVQDNVE
jgi:hypothetical protein